MAALTPIIIAAVAKNGVIGCNGCLPWYLPEDLRRFKLLTTGKAVIMGRNTWESLPPTLQPLPKRRNIVVSTSIKNGLTESGAEWATNLHSALELCSDLQPYIIGGAKLYAIALPFANKLELTEIGVAFAGDTFFPSYDKTIWQELQRHEYVSLSGLPFAFVTYCRKKTAPSP